MAIAAFVKSLAVPMPPAVKLAGLLRVISMSWPGGELVMKSLIGAAVVAGALAFAGPAAANPAAAASPQMKTQATGASDATDFSARRYYRRYYHQGYRPYYYARPYY